MNTDIEVRDKLCAVHGGHAPTDAHHRIPGNRRDNRASNLLGVCREAHDFIHAHPRDSRTMGWLVSKHGRDTAKASVWIEAGEQGRGFYLLADDYTLTLVEPG